MQQSVFVDTNILLSQKFSFENFKKVYLNIVTIEELDKLKREERISYQARQAIKKIKNASNKEIRLNASYSGVSKFLEHKNDNVILASAYDIYSSNKECLFLTDDYNLIIKAQSINLPCEMFTYNNSEEIYNGIRQISLTEEQYVSLLENSNKNIYGLHLNEYLIIDNVTNGEQYLLVWNGNYFEDVKIKPISNKYINKINPLDIYQKAFMHMLQNNDVKIKITDSPYGAGKSFLMIHWALQMIDREKFDKLFFIKGDTPPKGRKEFPALPGTLNEKCDPLMGVLCDTTSESNLTDILLRNNKLEILPIQFVKGRSIRNSIIYVNEAQDFRPSEMEGIISRLGEGSVVLLDGSSQQIDNKYCLYRNGFMVASNNYKNSKNSAQVNMIEDFRSEISKEVAEMDWHD